jgi:hypothetical protein
MAACTARTLRNLSFLLLIVACTLLDRVHLRADVFCEEITESRCATGQSRYGFLCDVNPRFPNPNTCSDFYNDVCEGYCSEHVPPGTVAPYRDISQSYCSGTGVSMAGTCWCKGSHACVVDPPTCGEECNGDPACESCECGGGDWLWVNGDPGGYSCESPILIDLSNNTAQYHLTSEKDGVMFDLNGDGVKEHLSWTALGSSVAFLAMDRNGNGSIDTGAELFGNFTAKRDGSLARNGFDALTDLEDPGHRDGAITPLDSAYSKLLLWLDNNHDGLSSASELSTLAGAGVARIETSYVTRRRRDQYGNRYRYEGVATIMESGQLRSRRIFDVFFVRGQ